jgi:hypothetical protein
MLSENFDDPYSLSNIAKTIRQSIHRLRNPKILGPGIAKIDQLMRRTIRNNKSSNPKLISNEFSVLLQIDDTLYINWSDW